MTPIGQPLPYCNIGALVDQLLDSAMYRERKDQIGTFNKVDSETMHLSISLLLVFSDLGLYCKSSCIAIPL